MKWCCPGFSAQYDNADEAGFTVLVGRNELGQPEFLLQHRAIEKGFTLVLPSDARVYLMTETGMRFCPWCGADLEKWYGKALDSLHRPQLRRRLQTNSTQVTDNG